MLFSSAFNSSPHCLPSPDGTRIAALLSSSICIRAVEYLQPVRTVKLPADLAGSVTTFVWSPSSKKLLLATADQIHVFSATESNYHAVIRNPSSTIGKLTFVDFGATENETCVCSAFGIKFSIFNLSSRKAVEITNPKFHNALSAARGFSFRPRTHHLALLTRTSGKDSISIHSPETRDVERSWNPDVIDAQGLFWTPDGKWLVVWESAAQGHRMLLFTSDGHIFKEWCGPSHVPGDYRLGAGVKFTTLSPNGHHIAAADSGRCVYLLNTSTMKEQSRFCHLQAIEPYDTLQVWQEQSGGSHSDTSMPSFIRASQPVAPQGRPASHLQDFRAGCEYAVFDCSSALLATKLEEAPSTVWIWDVATSELRAVLMFHANVFKIDWHPTQTELLLVRCEGESSHSIFVWDPLSGGPRSINFRSEFPDGKISGRVYTSWLQSDKAVATLFIADSMSAMLGSLTDSADNGVPWREVKPKRTISIKQNRRGHSPSGLVSAPAEESEDHETDM